MVTINDKQFGIIELTLLKNKGLPKYGEFIIKPDTMGGMTHPFHINGTQFKIISIDGNEPPVAIDAGETVILAVKFNNKGEWDDGTSENRVKLILKITFGLQKLGFFKEFSFFCLN